MTRPLLAALAIGAAACGQTEAGKPQQLEPDAAELRFIERLDQAWGKGDPKKVLALFRIIHPQVRNEIDWRVRGTASDGKAERRSKVGGVHQIRLPNGRIQRALYLEANIRLTGLATVQANYFEVLVLHPRAPDSDRVQGLMLLRTTADAQSHVCTKGHAHTGLASPIGSSLCAGCKACNYTVGSPADGRWVVLVRPPQLTGCPESVEVYALDKDLAMEFSAHPSTAEDPLPIKMALQMARSRLLCNARARGRIEPFRFGTLDGWTTKLQTADPKGRPRGWRLFGVQHGVVTFLMSVQAPAPLLKREAATVRTLLSTFRITDPDKKVDAASIIADHPGIGGFHDNNVLKCPSLGLELTGPEGWHKFQCTWHPVRFGWRCTGTSSSLTVALQYRCEAAWTPNGTRQWIDSWVRAYRQDKRFPAFRVARAPAERALAGRNAYYLQFDYRAKRGRARGFSWFLPLGRHLIVMFAEARPGTQQKATLELLTDRVAGLRLR